MIAEENIKSAYEILKEPLSNIRVTFADKFLSAKLTMEDFVNCSTQLLNDAQKINGISGSELGQEIKNAYTFLKTGKCEHTPKVDNPALQLVWGMTLACYVCDPKLQQSIGKGLPVYKLGVWKDIRESYAAKAELRRHAFMITKMPFLQEDVTMKWGACNYPNVGFYYDKKNNNINLDMLWGLIGGFEHSRAMQLHEIGHSQGTLLFTPKMQEITEKYNTLNEKVRKGSATKEEYHQLKLLKKEYDFRFSIFDEAENSYANRFAVNASDFGRVRQNIGYDLNSVETQLFYVGKRLTDPVSEVDKRQDNPRDRAYNLKQAIRFSFYVNNGIIEDVPDEWRKLGVNIDWIEYDSPKGEHLVGMEAFKVLRDRTKKLEELQLKEKDYRKSDKDIYETSLDYARQRCEIIDEIFEGFAQKYCDEILKETENNEQQDQNDDSQNSFSGNNENSSNDNQQNESDDKDNTDQQSSGGGNGQGKDKKEKSDDKEDDQQSSGDKKDQGKDGDKESEKQEKGKEGDKQSEGQDEGKDEEQSSDEKEGQGEDGDEQSEEQDQGKDDDKESEKQEKGKEGDKQSEGQDEGKDEEQSSDEKEGQGEDGDEQSEEQDQRKDGDEQSEEQDQRKDGDEQSEEQDKGKDGEQSSDDENGKLVEDENGDIEKEEFKSAFDEADENGMRPLQDLSSNPEEEAERRIQKLSENIEDDCEPENVMEIIRRPIEQNDSAMTPKDGSKQMMQELSRDKITPKALPKTLMPENEYSKIISNHFDMIEQLKEKFIDLQNKYYDESPDEEVHSIMPDVGDLRVDIPSYIERLKKQITGEELKEKDFENFLVQGYNRAEVKAPIDIAILIDNSGSMHWANTDKFAIELGCILFQATRDNPVFNVYVALMTEPTTWIAKPGENSIDISRRLATVSSMGVGDDKIADNIQSVLKEVDKRDPSDKREGLVNFFMVTDGGHTDSDESYPLIDNMITENVPATFNWILTRDTGYVQELIDKHSTGVGPERIEYASDVTEKNMLEQIMKIIEHRVDDAKEIEAVATMDKKENISTYLSKLAQGGKGER